MYRPVGDALAARRSPVALVAAFALGLSAAACGSSAPPEPTEPTAAGGDDITDRRPSSPGYEDEAEDDGLAVSGLRGRLENYDIQQGVEPHAADLERCFTKERSGRRYLGGRVELAFTVARDGAVASVHAQQSDLGSWPVERCLIEVGMEMRFPKPKGGAPAEFTLPLDFPAQRPATTWDAGRAQAEVAALAPALVECAEAGGDGSGAGDGDGAGAGDQGGADSAPEGLWVTLYVGTRGQVQAAGFASESGPFGHAWAVCAEAQILSWTLSDPQGRVTKARFAYPVPAGTDSADSGGVP